MAARILVTGHLGYVGSVLVPVLHHAGFEVIGMDLDLFAGCDFGRTQEPVATIRTSDIREVEVRDLVPFDAVIHLAALSDDTCADLHPRLADDINHVATVRLAECCKKAGVRRFVFASTCSVYGHGGSKPVDETSPTKPLSVYAASKLRCESELLKLADESFSPVILRGATVYGVSPRMRLDLVVNDFAASAMVNGQVLARTCGSAWRPLVHVEDLAKVYLAMLTAPNEWVSSEIFNVIPHQENFRIRDIAECVTERVPGSTYRMTPDFSDDRSYAVDGSKLARLALDLRMNWTLTKGIGQLCYALDGGAMTPALWRGDRYRRAARLQKQIESGALGLDLRRFDRRPARVRRLQPISVPC
ncbi:MAG: SDR family oxidoreductase [Planctomycetota bacterium]